MIKIDVDMSATESLREIKKQIFIYGREKPLIPQILKVIYINYNQLYFVLRLNNCYGWPATGQNRTRRSSPPASMGGGY